MSFANKSSEKLETDEAAPLIYQQISKVMAEIEAVPKKGVNSHHNYKYRQMDDVFNALHAPLHRNGVFFIPEVIERIETPKGNMLHVKLRIRYRIFARDGSAVEAVVWGEAIDNQDKASNKAMTAALKYMLTQVLCLPTEGIDDADQFSPNPEQQEIKQSNSRHVRAPAAADPSLYICTFGKYQGQKLKDIDRTDLENYFAYIERDAAAKGVEIKGKVLEFMSNAEKYLLMHRGKEQ